MFFENKTELTLSERRALILHLLYSLEMNNYEKTVYEVLRDYANEYQIYIDFNDSIVNEVEGVVESRDQIDEEIRPYLKKWRIDRISIILKLIIRYAVWEFKNKKSDPALIINEAVELAKGFAEDESYKFVNGVLDIWIKQKIEK